MAMGIATEVAGDACPECGSTLVERTVKPGKKNEGRQFVGCSSFPRCRYTSGWSDVQGSLDRQGEGGSMTWLVIKIALAVVASGGLTWLVQGAIDKRRNATETQKDDES